MQFAIMRKADAETEAGRLPDKQLIDEMTSYNEKIVRTGKMKFGAGLAPSSRGARVSFSGGKPKVIDGPFAEAKELVAGFSIIEADSLAEVIELVKQWPQSDGHGSAQIEIRPILTAKDLGFSDEQIERYGRLEAEQAQQQ